MGAASFISRKLRFKGKVSVWATAISSFVMIVAVSIASGFKAEMRKAIGWYSAGIKGGAKLRGRINEMETMEDLKEVVKCFMA